MKEKIKVYIRIDKDNHIVEVISSIALKDITGYIEIDEGLGDKYSHACGYYFEKPLRTEEGLYTYKFIDGKIIDSNLPN